MKPKKPDRWERMVRRCLLYGYGSCVPKLVSMAYAIKLLRQQHAWTVKMALKQYNELAHSDERTALHLLDRILDNLKRRAL